MKFETHKYSDDRLLEEFLKFDFSRGNREPSSASAVGNFVKLHKLTNSKAEKLQESLHDDLACVLTDNRCQPVRMTRHGPRLSGVASIEELLTKIEGLLPRPMWEFSAKGRKVHMLPVVGACPEQRFYQIVLSLLIDGTFWRLSVCRYCGRIFFGTRYCSARCREAWHNRYTRAPRVIQRRAEGKQKALAKKTRKRKPKQMKADLGASVFEEFKTLKASKALNPLQEERLSWIEQRLPPRTEIKTDLPWDELPKDHKKWFSRIREMEGGKAGSVENSTSTRKISHTIAPGRTISTRPLPGPLTDFGGLKTFSNQTLRLMRR